MGRNQSPQDVFRQLGVNTESPGFYDDPRFMEAERREPELLGEYAKFVRRKRYPTDYLTRSREVVTAACQFLYDRIVEEGMTGTCIDASMVLSRFLERQGIWNYAANGALTIFFDDSTGLDPVYFAPIMMPDNPAKAGHVWLYAPPFEVVDVSVSRQRYREAEQRYLPPYLLARRVSRCTFDAKDLMEPEARHDFWLRHGREPTLEDIQKISPGTGERIRAFGPIEVRYNKIRLRYLTPAVSAPEEPLEEYRNLRLGGKYPAELYDDFARTLATRGRVDGCGESPD